MFFCLVQAKLRFLKANCCLRVGLVLHGPNRIRGSMSPPFTCRMAKSCFLEASTRKLGKLCIVLLERHCSRRPAAQGILSVMGIFRQLCSQDWSRKLSKRRRALLGAMPRGLFEPGRVYSPKSFFPALVPTQRLTDRCTHCRTAHPLQPTLVLRCNSPGIFPRLGAFPDQPPEPHQTSYTTACREL